MDARKEAFLDRWEDEGWSLTYDDFRTVPARSHVAARDVDITSRFSTNVELKVPFVSSPMDTVTTSDMAIAMAKLGGIGVIHSALSPRDQRDEVRRVKKELNGLIEEPVCVNEDVTIREVLNLCREKRFDFRTFPVTNSEGRFVGLLGSKDFTFCEDPDTLVRDAMTPAVEITSGQKDTSIEQAYGLMTKEKKNMLPLINELGQVAGLYLFSEVGPTVRGDTTLHNVDAQGRLRVAAAVKTDGSAVERLKMMDRYLDAVVIDTAQGDSHFVFETLEAIKANFPELDVVVGNISNGDSARDLVAAGADGLRVGQGPGSICTTRDKTGIGVGQVTAIYEVAKATQDSNIPIMADGGIRTTGDVPVIIAAGAHSVMFGSKLAGADEAPGEVIRNDNGERVKFYRGMGSVSAMEDAGTRERYGFREGDQLFPEGVESLVPYLGPVEGVVDEFAFYLKRGMSYCGAATIEQHRQNTRLRRASPAVSVESQPHSVQVVTLRRDT